jgi:ABC-2 type transport system permease protein
MRRILYLVQKEFRQVFRDRAMLGILFVAPFIQLVLLGNAITTEVRHVTAIVCDEDNSPMSRDFIASLQIGEHFDVIGVETKQQALPEALNRGEAKMAVIIPKHLQRDALLGKRPSVQLLLDGLDGNTAGVAMSYVARIAARYQLRLLSEQPGLARHFRDNIFIEGESRFLYNPDLTSKSYVVPGIVALLLLIITVFLTSMGIVREKEIGTLEQLMVTPLRPFELILGKVIPFTLLGLVEISIAMGLVYVVFGIGIKGSVLLLFAEAGLFILTTLGVGIFISTISDTQQQALFVGWFFMIFAILLSGFFVPVANMPDSIQWLTWLNPLRYFLVILREIYLKGTPLQHLLTETLAMLVFGMTVFSAAVWRYRKRLA